MQRVVFQRPIWYKTLLGLSPVKSPYVMAGLIGIVLGLAFTSGNIMQVIAAAMIPFLIYAAVQNTIVVFLVWIGTTPVLSNFVRVNLGAGVPDITVNRSAAMLLILVLLFQVAIKMRDLKPVTFVERLMIAISILMLPAIFSALDPVQSGQQVFDMIITPFFVFYLAKNLITAKHELRMLVWTLGFVTLYCAVLGFQEHFTEYSLFTETHELSWKQEGMADRIQGPFPTPQVLGSVMVGGVVFFFYLLFNSKTLRLRLFSFVVLLIHTMVTYWTYRRSVWMGYFATLLFLGAIEKRFRKALIIGAIVGVFVAVLNWGEISETSVFQERVANARTVNDRGVIWLTAWEMIKDFPLFGTGLGWFGFYFKKYFTFFGNTVSTDYAHDIASPHNSYIRLWVECGPFVALLYIIMLIAMVRRVARILMGRDKHAIVGQMEVMVFVGIFLTQYVQALTTDMVFFGQYSAILLFLIGGVIFQTPAKARPRSRWARILGIEGEAQEP